MWKPASEPTRHRWRDRVPLVSWSDIAPSDLHEQGDPELVRDCYRERHLGLHVLGTYGISLGLLAIRCERRGADEIPLTLSIAETPPVIDTHPQRFSDEAA